MKTKACLKINFVVLTSIFVILLAIVALLLKSKVLLSLILVIFGLCGFMLLKKSPQYLIALIILFSTNCFYLLPSKVFGIQVEKLEIIVFIYAYILWIMQRFDGDKKISPFTKKLVFTVVVIFFGALIAKMNVGQSLILGVFYQTRIIIILAIFPIVSLLKEQKDSKNKIVSLIIKMSSVYSLLLIIQYFTITHFKFLALDINTSRFGNMRIYIYMFTVYSIFLCFSKMITGNIKQYFVPFILNFFTLIYIIQSRMVLFGVIVSLLVSFIYCSNFRKRSTYAIFFVFIIIGTVGLFLARNVIIDLINLGKNEIYNNSGNYMARLLEQDFYLGQVENPIFGRGYYSLKTESAAKFVTAYNYYDLTDIGIVGLFVTNGIIGIIWFVLIAISLLRYIRYLKKRCCDVCVPLCYLIFSISTCFTLLPFYYNGDFLLITFLLLELENYEFNVKNNLVNQSDLKLVEEIERDV